MVKLSTLHLIPLPAAQMQNPPVSPQDLWTPWTPFWDPPGPLACPVHVLFWGRASKLTPGGFEPGAVPTEPAAAPLLFRSPIRTSTVDEEDLEGLGPNMFSYRQAVWRTGRHALDHTGNPPLPPPEPPSAHRPAMRPAYLCPDMPC